MHVRPLRFFTYLLSCSFVLASVRAEEGAVKIRFRTGTTEGEVCLRDSAVREKAPRLSVAEYLKFDRGPASALVPRLDLSPAKKADQRPASEAPPAPPIAALPPVVPPHLAPSAPVGSLPPAGEELSLQPTTFTPYDRYLGPVRSVIATLEKRAPSLADVARLVKEGRGFRYITRDPYRADEPSVTEARRAGDCKSKALWLYQQLGDADALYVIGKSERHAMTSHAWVYWHHDDQWWILDCTDRSEPIAAASVESALYVPYYSFGKAGTYRHKATRLMLTGGAPLPAVAMHAEELH